ncbi:protein of unknown function [Methanoculleus bourgensis]|uniref:Uncharacterized protein n=1 Tax=Methanoculleus bourgensis TaxID=83986 RepID=A0A0X3BJX0_9EURY|nr:protein of unknown function [Methanoculleus bourgensis]
MPIKTSARNMEILIYDKDYSESELQSRRRNRKIPDHSAAGGERRRILHPSAGLRARTAQ